jgi:hypothetical protein
MAKTSSPLWWLCHEILLVCLPILLSVLEIGPPVQDSTTNALILEFCPFSCSRVCVSLTIYFLVAERNAKQIWQLYAIVGKSGFHMMRKVSEIELSNLD